MHLITLGLGAASPARTAAALEISKGCGTKPLEVYGQNGLMLIRLVSKSTRILSFPPAAYLKLLQLLGRNSSRGTCDKGQHGDTIVR